MRLIFSIFFFFVLFIEQSNAFTFKLTGYPEGKQLDLVLERYQSDAFLAVDTFRINSDTTLKIKEIFPRGLFSFKWANKGNPAEFIYSPKELNLAIEADYWTLLDGQLSITNSSENTAYSELLAIHARYAPRIEDAEMKMGILTPFLASYKEQLTQAEEVVEKLMQAEGEELQQVKVLYPGTFVGDILVPITAKPTRAQLADGKQKFDSYRSFLHQHFFINYPLNSGEILNHYAFQENIFFYLSNNTETSEDGAREGIDIIMMSLKTNEKVNSFVYNTLLSTFLKLNAEPLVKHLMENHSSGCSINLSIEDLKKLDALKTLSVGSKAPDILLYDDSEKAQSLSAFSAKNRYTVIYFWLSWCASCEKQSPILVQEYKKYNKKGLGVFAVSLDEDKQEWLSKIQPSDKGWINVSELVSVPQSSYVKKYAISTTPKTIIIDKEGTIIAKEVYGDLLIAKLTELFKD